MEHLRRFLFLILAAAYIHAMLVQPHKDVQDELHATNLTWYFKP